MNDYPRSVAAEIRAEMGRQMKSVADLARTIGKSHEAASRRYRGSLEFSINETMAVVNWLGISLDQLAPSTSADSEGSKGVGW